MEIKDIVKMAHDNARKKGFWEDWDSIYWDDGLYINENSALSTDELFNNAIATRLMLIVSEVSEVLDALRNGDRENFNEELADIVIRTCDLAGGLGVDLDTEIKRKMEINKNRPYKHGKKF